MLGIRMDGRQELLLTPCNQLLLAVSNAYQFPASPSEEAEAVNALAGEFGERMSADIRVRWKSKLVENLCDCELNAFDLNEWGVATLHRSFACD